MCHQNKTKENGNSPICSLPIFHNLFYDLKCRENMGRWRFANRFALNDQTSPVVGTLALKCNSGTNFQSTLGFSVWFALTKHDQRDVQTCGLLWKYQRVAPFGRTASPCIAGFLKSKLPIATPVRVSAASAAFINNSKEALIPPERGSGHCCPDSTAPNLQVKSGEYVAQPTGSAPNLSGTQWN